MSDTPMTDPYEIATSNLFDLKYWTDPLNTEKLNWGYVVYLSVRVLAYALLAIALRIEWVNSTLRDRNA